jgi:hypothetical protein
MTGMIQHAPSHLDHISSIHHHLPILPQHANSGPFHHHLTSPNLSIFPQASSPIPPPNSSFSSTLPRHLHGSPARSSPHLSPYPPHPGYASSLHTPDPPKPHRLYLSSPSYGLCEALGHRLGSGSRRRHVWVRVSDELEVEEEEAVECMKLLVHVVQKVVGA